MNFENKFRIPENFDIEEITNQETVAFCGKNFKKEKILYFIDAFLKSRAYHRNEINYKAENKKNAENYTPLSSEYLQEVVHDYQYYMNYLLANGILLTDGFFILGEKCYGFCLDSKYSGQRIKTEKVYDYKLHKAILQASEKRKAEAKKALWGYGYLTKWWASNKLKIDLKAAHLWIDEYEKNKIEKIELNDKIEDKSKAIKRAINTSEDFKFLTTSINSKIHSCAFSGESHRFYNPLSRLKRELRSFLTYDGQPLIDIDIKNSQPFFSTLLFKRSFWEANTKKKEQILALLDLDKDIYNKIRINNNYEHIITLLKTSETCFHEDFSINKYTELVLGGKFYEHILDNFKVLFPDRFDNRDNVKKEVLRILYVENEKINWEFYKPCIRFRELFDAVFQLFYLIKEVQYNYLPIILQRIESFLIHDIICKRISVEHPEIPLFTIHDNIITTKGNEGIVRNIMSIEIEKWIGHEPQLDCKDLTPINALPEIEVWMPIVGFEGSYEISSIGNVRSLERKVPHSKWERTVKSKNLVTRINNRGYKDVRLSKGGKTFTKLVHILTAEAFVPNPENKPYVNHLGGDKLKNHYINLAWVSHGENILHAYKTGLIRKMAKPVVDTCTGEKYISTKEASLSLGINQNTLKGYLNGRIKKNPTCLQYENAA